MTSNKAIVLLRVSSEAQAGSDRGSLPGQRRSAHQIAEIHGLEVIDEIEIRVSGARVLENAEFEALLKRIESPSIHGVIVTDLDRLMRPTDPGYYSIFRRFRDSGTILYTSAGPKDYRRDRLLMTLEAEIAALERERIVERTRRGREEKRRQGRRAEGPVGIPRAVTFDQATGEWAYQWPDALRIKEVFRLWLASNGTMSFREIARRTNLVPPDYAEPSGAVRRVLTQRLYCGVYRVDRRWQHGRPSPRAAHETYENVVLDPPLVPLGDFEKAQELLAKKRARRAPRKPHYEQGGDYAGHLECAACGASLWVVPDSRGYRGYLCGNSRDRQCPTGQTSIRLADPQLDAALEARLGDEGTFRRLLAKSAEEAAQRASSPPAEIARKIAQLQNQRARVKDAYEAGLFDLNDLRKRIQRLDGDLAVLGGLLAKQDVPIRVGPETVRDLVEVFGSWRDLQRSEKRELLAAYQIRIRVARPARRVLSVEQILIGVVGPSQESLTIYKKLRRYGMQ